MRSRARTLTLVASLCLGVSALVGVARAQQGAAAPPARPDGTASLQRPVDLDPKEMAKQADNAIARIDLGGRSVRKQLETARQARDVVKTLCLSDRLTQIDVTLRSARERKGALDAAVQRSDKELSGHEFTIIGVYRQRSERLVAEANQCVGSEVGIIGDTRVSMNVDPNIPADEGGAAPPLPPSLLAPPAACESCAFLSVVVSTSPSRARSTSPGGLLEPEVRSLIRRSRLTSRGGSTNQHAVGPDVPCLAAVSRKQLPSESLEQRVT